MRKQLIDLREKMRQYGIDAYLIPTTDFHGRNMSTITSNAANTSPVSLALQVQ